MDEINVDHVRFQSLSQVEALEILKEFNKLNERIHELEQLLKTDESVD